MLPVSPFPDSYRRAIRLALGVGIPCLLGLGVIGPEHWAWSQDFVAACSWAGISSAAILSSSVLAKVSQAGLERTLGTVLGGGAAFLTVAIGSWFWNESSDGVVLAVSAAVWAFLSVVIGDATKLDSAGRLFVITFLLVIFGASSGQDPFELAVTRVGGILGGVLLMVVLSVTVLPKSASMEALHNVSAALAGLGQLNALAWRGPVPLPEARARALVPALQGSRTEGAPSDLESLLLAPPESDAAALRAQAAALAFEEECEAALARVQQSCGLAGEHAGLSEKERLLGAPWGKPVFLPAPFEWMRPSRQLWPAQDLAAAAAGARRAGRLLFQLTGTLQGGFQALLQDMLGDDYPTRMLELTARCLDDCLRELCAAFPQAPAVRPDPLVQLVTAVRQLVSASDFQRRQMIAALKRGGGGPSHRRRDAPAQEEEERWGGILHGALAYDPLRAVGQGMNANGGGGGSGTRAISGEVGADGGSATALAVGPPSVVQPKLASAPRPREAADQAVQEASLALPASTHGLTSQGAWTRVDAGAGGDAGAATPSPRKEGSENNPAKATFTDPLTQSAVEAQTGLPPLPVLFRSPLRAARSTGSAASEASAVAAAAAAAQAQTQAGLSLFAPRPAAGTTPLSAEALDAHDSVLRKGVGGAGAVGASPSQPLQPSPLRQGSGRAREAAGQGPWLVAPQAVRGASSSLAMLLFPETPEGRVAQVRWYSFQHLLEELAEELAELQQLLNRVLHSLPR